MMIRNALASLVLAVFVTTAVAVLAAQGFFAPAAQWLAGLFRAESFAAGALRQAGWLQHAAVFLAALGAGGAAVDHGPIGPKAAVAALCVLVSFFFALTGAFYGFEFDAFAPALAAVLAFAGGLACAETPRGRRRRELHAALAGRASLRTLEEIFAAPVPVETEGALREISVLALRTSGQAPGGEAASAFLSGQRALVATAAAFLRKVPGCVLGLPEADGVRAFFGLAPGRTTHAVEAAEAALALAQHLQAAGEEDATQPAWGLGLNSGAMLIGLHGPASQPALCASGPQADFAAHLAATAPEHRVPILCGKRAQHLVRDHFDFPEIPGTAFHTLSPRQSAAAEVLPAPREPAPWPRPASAAKIPANATHEPAVETGSTVEPFPLPQKKRRKGTADGQ